MLHVGNTFIIFSSVHKVIVNSGRLSVADAFHFRIDDEDDRLGQCVAFHDVELAAAAVYSTALAVVGLVVVDASAFHVDDAVGNVDAASIAFGGLVVFHIVAVDADVAVFVVDAAAVLLGGVAVDDG